MKQTIWNVAAAFALALAAAACSHTPSGQPLRVSPGPGGSPQNLWRSLTTGREYRVKINGDHLEADWVNIPAMDAQRGSYIRSQCQRQGDKWVGTSKIYLPCTVGTGKAEHIANTCHLTLQFEIDTVTKYKISGRAQTLRGFDCATCTVKKAVWDNFVWVPVG